MKATTLAVVTIALLVGGVAQAQELPDQGHHTHRAVSTRWSEPILSRASSDRR